MNYRHAFHAGNHADVFKHTALALVLSLMTRKETPLAVLDTHAGAGAYDLFSAEATRSPEWRDGVGRLADPAVRVEAPAALGPYLAAIDSAAPLYPGSPEICAGLLRAHDRYVGCDLHEPTFAALKRWARARPNAYVHRRDGYEAMGALLPPAERRGVVLIDPPFEDFDAEAAAAVSAIRGALRRFAHGVYLWWRPMKDPARLARIDDALLSGLTTSGLRADLAVGEVAPERPLAASSLVILNPPWPLADQLQEAMPWLAARLAQTPAADWSLRAWRL